MNEDTDVLTLVALIRAFALDGFWVSGARATARIGGTCASAFDSGASNLSHRVKLAVAKLPSAELLSAKYDSTGEPSCTTT
jgi:hypothetical protein